MAAWIALFRGINVGGRHKLPMAELVAVLESLGLRDVHTYIQSGNAIFRSRSRKAAALAARIETAVASGRGFRPRVIVLGVEELRAVIAACPFGGGDPESKAVHVYFLAQPPEAPDLEAMNAAKADDEEYSLTDHALYLHTPGGIGTSRLARDAERFVGVPATARNWRSAHRILAIAEGLA